MATLAEQVEYQAQMLDLSAVAIADLVAQVGTLTGTTANSAATLVREAVPVLVAEYGAQAASLSADFYDEARYAALGAAATAYTATLAPTPPEDFVQDALGWALAPLFAPETPDPATTMRRTAGKLQGLVTGTGRDTIERNAAADPVGTRYMRHASANACAFCRMLALDNTYLTAESATRVVGEVDPRELSRTMRGQRGSQPLGEKYHDNCRCTAVPIFPGEAEERAPYVDEWREQYDVAARATGTKRGDVSALLGKWRELYGAR